MGHFLSHTECHTAPLAFSRERWMLILDFGHPRAMVSQNEISPSLWDGIRRILKLKCISKLTVSNFMIQDFLHPIEGRWNVVTIINGITLMISHIVDHFRRLHLPNLSWDWHQIQCIIIYNIGCVQKEQFYVLRNFYINCSLLYLSSLASRC